MGAQCVGYSTTYPKMTADALKTTPQLYHHALVSIKIDAFTDGFYVSKVLKANKNGTSTRFKAIENQKKAEEVKEEIKKDIDRLKPAGVREDVNNGHERAKTHGTA